MGAMPGLDERACGIEILIFMSPHLNPHLVPCSNKRDASLWLLHLTHPANRGPSARLNTEMLSDLWSCLWLLSPQAPGGIPELQVALLSLACSPAKQVPGNGVPFGETQWTLSQLMGCVIHGHSSRVGPEHSFTSCSTRAPSRVLINPQLSQSLKHNDWFC